MSEMEAIQTPDLKNILTRAGVLEITTGVIEDLKKKGESGRFRHPELEKLRDAKTRLLIQAIGVYGGLLRDNDLKELEARIEALEARR
jgi:hypothetical protein